MTKSQLVQESLHNEDQLWSHAMATIIKGTEVEKPKTARLMIRIMSALLDNGITWSEIATGVTGIQSLFKSVAMLDNIPLEQDILDEMAVESH